MTLQPHEIALVEKERRKQEIREELRIQEEAPLYEIEREETHSTDGPTTIQFG